MEAFFKALYWIGMIGMSASLAAITVFIFVIGFKFLKDRRIGLGTGCIAFSLIAGSMIGMMLYDKSFFLS